MRKGKIARFDLFNGGGADAAHLSQTVLSRKRKLCELYAVATSTEPIPQYRDFTLQGHDNGHDLQPSHLTLFLEQNNIEKYGSLSFPSVHFCLLQVASRPAADSFRSVQRLLLPRVYPSQTASACISRSRSIPCITNIYLTCRSPYRTHCAAISRK